MTDSQTASTLDVVHKLEAAVNNHDVNAFVALCTDDIIWETTTPPDGDRYEGIVAVRAAGEAFFKESPNATFETEELHGLRRFSGAPVALHVDERRRHQRARPRRGSDSRPRRQDLRDALLRERLAQLPVPGSGGAGLRTRAPVSTLGEHKAGRAVPLPGSITHRRVTVLARPAAQA